MVGINTDEGAVSLDLFLLDLTYVVNWVITGVLSQGHWNFFQGIGESSDGVLFNTRDLISLLLDFDGAGKLSGSTSSNDVVVLDHVSDDTDGIMETSSSFITNSLRSSSY